MYARVWLEADDARHLKQVSLERWRSRLAGRTFPVYYSWLHPFLESIKKTPDESVAWAKALSDKREALDVIQTYVGTMTARFNTKRIAYAGLRSFFMHNRVDLPADRYFRIQGDQEPVERKLRIEHVRRLIGLAVEPWRTALLIKWHAFLDNEGLVYFSNNHGSRVVETLKGNADICRLSMPGRKKLKNITRWDTFIGPEPLAALREYFENNRGWPKPGEPVFVYATKGHEGKPIKVRTFQEAWMRLARRAKLPGLPSERGKNSGIRYGYNVHNTRDLAISHLMEVPNLKETVVEYWAGHEIDPLQYRDLTLKPKFVEDQYRLAAPYLNIMGQPIRSVEIDQRLVNAVFEEIKKNPNLFLQAMGITPKQEESHS